MSILYYWIELAKISTDVLCYIPIEFYNDRHFISQLLNIYDINVLYYYINLKLVDFDIISKLNPVFAFKKYLNDPETYKFLLNEDVITYLIDKQKEFYNENNIDLKELANVIVQRFEYMIPDLLYINYRLYFNIPVVNRKYEYFNIILPILHKLFRCDETMIELDRFYDVYDKISLDTIAAPTYNICKYYIEKDPCYINYVPPEIDMGDVITRALYQITISSMSASFFKYLTPEICDAIIENSISKGNMNSIIISYILPPNLITIKSLKLILLNEKPVIHNRTNGLYDSIPEADYIRICTEAGLIFILVKTHHTYDIYNNFIKYVQDEYNVGHIRYLSLTYVRMFIESINFKLFNTELFYNFFYITPELINYLNDEIISSDDALHAFERYIHYVLASPEFKPPMITIFRQELLYKIKDKFPILELYSVDAISLEKFIYILYENQNNIVQHINVINYFLKQYVYDECISVVENLIIWGVNANDIYYKIMTLNLDTDKDTDKDKDKDKDTDTDKDADMDKDTDKDMDKDMDKYKDINTYKYKQLCKVIFKDKDKNKNKNKCKFRADCNCKAININTTTSNEKVYSIDDFYFMLKTANKDNIINIVSLYLKSSLSSYKIWSEYNMNFI